MALAPPPDTTILRSLKGHARVSSVNGAVRVAGIDDWAWRKGASYGTIIVDLERRRVVDVLADRSAETTAGWLKKHPGVEVVSRDRAGIYAEAARQGAPQARQVADRFHLVQNFRESVERQLGLFEAPIPESQVKGSPHRTFTTLRFDAGDHDADVFIIHAAASSPKTLAHRRTSGPSRPRLHQE